MKKIIFALILLASTTTFAGSAASCIFTSGYAAQNYYSAMSGSTIAARKLLETDLKQDKQCSEGVLDLIKEGKDIKYLLDESILLTANYDWRSMAASVYKKLRKVHYADDLVNLTSCDNGFAFRAMLFVIDNGRTYYPEKISYAMRVENESQLEQFKSVLESSFYYSSDLENVVN